MERWCFISEHIYFLNQTHKRVSRLVLKKKTFYGLKTTTNWHKKAKQTKNEKKMGRKTTMEYDAPTRHFSAHINAFDAIIVSWIRCMVQLSTYFVCPNSNGPTSVLSKSQIAMNFVYTLQSVAINNVPRCGTKIPICNITRVLQTFKWISCFFFSLLARQMLIQHSPPQCHW